MEQNFKSIAESIWVTGRGVLLILKENNNEVKLHDNINLYDDSYNFILKTSVRGIERQGNTGIALNVRGNLESMKPVKFYKTTN